MTLAETLDRLDEWIALDEKESIKSLINVGKILLDKYPDLSRQVRALIAENARLEEANQRMRETLKEIAKRPNGQPDSCVFTAIKALEDSNGTR